MKEKKGSRLHDDSAVIVGPHFDFLDCSHDLKKGHSECAVAILARDLGRDV